MYFKIGVREGNAFSRTLTFSVDCDAENSYFKFYVALKFFYSDVLIKIFRIPSTWFFVQKHCFDRRPQLQRVRIPALCC